MKNIRSLRQLGAMDILCTDKTKTITQNKVILEYDMNIRTQEDAAVLRYAYLNSYYQTGVKNLMDHAIIKQTEEKSKSDARLKDLLVYEKVDEIPFDSIRQKISVAIRNEENECRLITKGAVDKVLAACTYVQYNNTTAAITDELRRKILRKADHIGKNGMRLIAVAHKVMVSSGRTLSEKDESGMIFDGYLSFLDPPGENAANAVKAFSGQGIPVKILTGDDRQVTLSACKHIGLRSDNMLLGSDVGKMSDSELSKVTEKVNVFAELSEDQKSRIVRILKKNSHTVGFLGGGVHDISSMRAADIGISDETAIPAAKVSADIILPEKSLTLLHEVTKTAKDTILTIGAVSQPSYVSMAKES